MRIRRAWLRISAPALAAAWLCACAANQDRLANESVRAPMDRVLARLVSKGELDKAQRAADSLSASKEPAEREVAAYWKVVTWLYRDEPDSALALLEASQGKWTGGLRKVHTTLFLALAREASQNRAARAHHDEAARALPPDKTMQDRVDALQKEAIDLREENTALETEKEKYQKLLKDLETIR